MKANSKTRCICTIKIVLYVCFSCLANFKAQNSRRTKSPAFSFSIAGDLLSWGSDRLTGMQEPLLQGS